MNEDNYDSVSDGSLEKGYNHESEGGSYVEKSFDEETYVGGDQHHAPDTYVGGDQYHAPNTYVGGYQQNMGKTLVRRREGSGPFGKFRNNRLSGYVSVLGIAIILGILVLVISFFAN